MLPFLYILLPNSLKSNQSYSSPNLVYHFHSFSSKKYIPFMAQNLKLISLSEVCLGLISAK